MVDPETLKPWVGIFRDVVFIFVGVFMLLHETISQESPRALVLAGALTVLGIPAAIRADALRLKEPPEEPRRDGKEERWSHLP